MSDLEPRRRGGLSRRQREGRAYSLVLATGGLAVLTLVLLVLVIADVIGFGLFLIVALLTVGAAVLLRRTLDL